MAFKAARMRAKRGLNEVATIVGVSKQSVNAWERGVYEPDIETIKQLADLYGCTVDELLREDVEDGSG